MTADKPVLVLYLHEHPQCFLFTSREQVLAWADNLYHEKVQAHLVDTCTPTQLATSSRILRLLQKHIEDPYNESGTPRLYWTDDPFTVKRVHCLDLSIQHQPEQRYLHSHCTSKTFPWAQELKSYHPSAPLPSQQSGRLASDEIHRQVALDTLYGQLVLAKGKNGHPGLKLNALTVPFLIVANTKNPCDSLTITVKLTPQTFEELGLELLDEGE